MIRLTERNGQIHYVAPQNIARVTEAGVSSRTTLLRGSPNQPRPSGMPSAMDGCATVT